VPFFCFSNSIALSASMLHTVLASPSILFVELVTVFTVCFNNFYFRLRLCFSFVSKFLLKNFCAFFAISALDSSRELVASFAKSFSIVVSTGPFSSHNIFSEGDRLKMFWVYAFSVSAKMINHQSGRYLALCQLIRKSVCSVVNFIGNKLAITFSIQRGCPIPTSISFVYFIIESFNSRFVHDDLITISAIKGKFFV